jgi:proline dehydrogenase
MKYLGSGIAKEVTVKSKRICGATNPVYKDRFRDYESPESEVRKYARALGRAEARIVELELQVRQLVGVLKRKEKKEKASRAATREASLQGGSCGSSEVLTITQGKTP